MTNTGFRRPHGFAGSRAALRDQRRAGPKIIGHREECAVSVGSDRCVPHFIRHCALSFTDEAREYRAPGVSDRWPPEGGSPGTQARETYPMEPVIYRHEHLRALGAVTAVFGDIELQLFWVLGLKSELPPPKVNICSRVSLSTPCSRNSEH